MKKLFWVVLTLVSLAGCKDKDVNPSLSGSFVGLLSIESTVNHGNASYSEDELTLTQLSERSVKVSSRHFQPFVIDNLTQSAEFSYLAGDGGNLFRYFGGSGSRSLLIDWTTPIESGSQTIHFGGSKKK